MRHSTAEYNARWKQDHPQLVAEQRRRELAKRDPLVERERKRLLYHRNKHKHPRLRARGVREPFKVRAKQEAQNALKRGDLVKPRACQSCGRAEGRLHMHHPDYGFPLVVEFLCPMCHGARHRKALAREE